MLRSDAGIVQPRADAVGVHRLPRGLLYDVSEGSLQHARGAHAEGGAVSLLALDSVPGRLDADQLGVLVVDEGVEGANGIGSAADAGDHGVRELAGLLEHLPANFLAHDGLEVADDGGEGVGSDGGADEVVGGADIGDPVAHGLVDGVFKSPLAGLDGYDLGSQGVHAEDVELLTFAVHRTHVDGAVQSEHGTDGGGGNSMLSRSSFGNDSGFPDALGQEGLSDGIVNFMSTGVCKILTFEPNGSSARQFGETLGNVERSGPPDEILPQQGNFGHEIWIVFDLIIFLRDFAEGFGKGLRDVLPPELSEHGGRRCRIGIMGLDVRNLSENGGLVGRRGLLVASGDEMGDGIADVGRLHLRSGAFAEGFRFLENGASHHDAVRNVGDLVDLLGSGDAEPDGEREVGLGPHPLDEVGEVGGKLGPGARHSRARHAVQERAGGVDEELDPLVRGGGRDEGDETDPLLLASPGERLALLRGKIHDDEAVRTRGFGRLRKGLEAVLVERVVVAHEDDGDGEAPATGLRDHREALIQFGRAAGDGDLVRLLDRRAVRLGVRVRNSQFDDGGTSLLHGEKDGYGVFFGGIPRRHERYKGRSTATLGHREGLFNTPSASPFHAGDGGGRRRLVEDGAERRYGGGAVRRHIVVGKDGKKTGGRQKTCSGNERWRR
mmetsp:Transcript_14468/g.31799  ORF Transcript_14468/g.31799 Transcript_14468/m.31799 type:complete len:665 (+) Transcript_14468:311-2305(+)